MNYYNLELISKCKKGDGTAIENLLNICENNLYKTNYYLLGDKKLASSVLNQIITEMFSSIETIDEKSCISKWLYRLTINSCREMEDKKPFVDKIDYNDVNSIIKSTITQLPFDQRAVLVLHDIQKLSYADISEILELPLTLVGNNLHKARLTVKKVLKLEKKGKKHE